MLLSSTLTSHITKNLNEGLIKDELDIFLPKAFSFIWAVILALIVYWIGVRIINIFRKGIKLSMERHNIEGGVQTFTDSLVKMAGYIILAVIILGLFGITSTSIAAAVAALGLTAGLSLQGSLSNFAGGVLILILKPFVVGDYIIEDANKNEGTVKEITIFYTKLSTVDNRIVVIPNGTLSNSSLTNVTASKDRKIDATISISYDDDIRTAKEILEKLVEEEKRKLSNTEIQIFVRELGASSVDLGVRFWVRTEDYWPVYWDLLEHAKYALEEAGLSIPFSQVDVHLDGMLNKK